MQDRDIATGGRSSTSGNAKAPAADSRAVRDSATCAAKPPSGAAASAASAGRVPPGTAGPDGGARDASPERDAQLEPDAHYFDPLGEQARGDRASRAGAHPSEPAKSPAAGDRSRRTAVCATTDRHHAAEGEPRPP
jgi:hypothetical protein